MSYSRDHQGVQFLAQAAKFLLYHLLQFNLELSVGSSVFVIRLPAVAAAKASLIFQSTQPYRSPTMDTYCLLVAHLMNRLAISTLVEERGMASAQPHTHAEPSGTLA